MKKFLSLTVSALLLLSLAACSSTESAESTAASEAAPASEAASTSMADSEAAPAADAGDLQVALVMTGPINDQGWNASAYAGLTKIEEQLGAEVAFTESVAAADLEEVYRGYADIGFDVIIGHGFEFGDVATAVAPDYPETFFFVTSSDISQEPNVAGLQNRNDQQGFLAGAVAAQQSQSGVVGAIGGGEIPSIIDFINGFEQGALYVNPDATVLTNFTGDFNDPAPAKQLAASMIAEGADVLSHSANAAGLGVFEAVGEAGEGVWMIGAIDDQYDILPEQTITSALSNLSDSMVEATERYVNGEIEAIGYRFGVEEGVVGLADFRDYPITEEQQAQLDEISAMLASGEIEVTTEA